ncbi:hypothetical protein RUM4293_03579 [Ruegeria atlantica]|uniref:Uncharacterized protein n=1 Tax=Ruegeria atlantica TaxID=81569 RepID=A0A0P1ERL3_9RHOB|nr:hypothetical protein RUM4293_03579 [Ruegeria atlantica]
MQGFQRRDMAAGPVVRAGRGKCSHSNSQVADKADLGTPSISLNGWFYGAVSFSRSQILIPPTGACVAPQPASDAEVIAVNQEQKRDERGHRRKSDHWVSVDWKAAVVQSKGI